MVKWLEGNVAVITGASSGIGRSIVEKYVEEGAQVVAFARNLDVLRNWRRPVRAGQGRCRRCDTKRGPEAPCQ